MNIKVDRIPIGYTAIDDDCYSGPGSPIGEGKTPEAAIDDLMEQLEDEDGSKPAVREALGWDDQQ